MTKAYYLYVWACYRNCGSRKRQEVALREAEQGLFSTPHAGSVVSPPEAEGKGIVLSILYTAQTSLSSGLSCSNSSDPSLPQVAQVPMDVRM